MSETRRMAREMKTRYDGVWARHKKDCGAPDGGRCRCKPSYIARVYDRATGRKVASPSYPTIDAARSWRTDKLAAIGEGRTVTPSTHRLRDVVDQFERAVRDRRALNKRRMPYKPSAAADLEGAFRVWVVPELGTKKMDTIRRGDVQRLVDLMVAEGLSGSRVRTVVNAIRSLYTYAIDREICHASPVPSSIRLPAMNEAPRDRTATPTEIATLIGAVPLADALPYALAAYAGGRRGEIRRLDWTVVDLRDMLIEWGADEQARKTRAAQRRAPIVPVLAGLLREQWMAQGKPAAGLVCPGRKPRVGTPGLLSGEALQDRVDAVWEPTDEDGRPLPKVGDRITLHECRHVFATWMDQAGVRAVVKSAILGHVAEGGITQSRYTHVPIADVHEGGRLLARFLARRAARKVG